MPSVADGASEETHAGQHLLLVDIADVYFEETRTVVYLFEID
jgi:hypothetical protein